MKVASLWTFLLLFLFAGCAHTQRAKLPEPLETYSIGDDIYEGIENNFSYRATLLNRPVTDYLLQKKSKFYDWSTLKIQAEQNEVDLGRETETQVFLSFYTPNPKDTDLTDKNSIWRVYLELGSERFEAKIQRDKRKLTEVQSLYPYHTRWGTAYKLTFPVPIQQIENSSSRLTITGPLGKRTIEFPAAASSF